MITRLLGDSAEPEVSDFSNAIALQDHKIRFMTEYCGGAIVLDVGCVQHNPENYQSKYWLHKALVAVAARVVGIDLYEPGVRYLREKGYHVAYADAENFDLGEQFDVICAGDLIEHLGNPSGFLESCRRHLDREGLLLISTPNPWYWRNVLKAAVGSEVRNNPEHTCWICPRTLRQLASRHGFVVERFIFGSRYLKDRIVPLPRGWKHTSFHAALRKE